MKIKNQTKRLYGSLALGAIVVSSVQLGFLDDSISNAGIVNIVNSSSASAQTLSEISNAKGTITIHNRLGTSLVPGEGTTVSPTPGEPISGTTFKVYRIEGLNPNLHTDWKKYSEINRTGVTKSNNGVPTKIDNYNLKLEATLVTDKNGEAKTDSLPIGFFYIAQDNVQSSGGKLNTTSAPFLASIPLADPEGAEWNFDVQVYPKSTTMSVTKKVQDKGVNAGSGTITYTVEGDVPVLPQGQNKYNRYIFSDQQPSQVRWDKKQPKVQFVAGKEGEVKATLDKEDYVFEEVSGKEGLVKLTLTQSGLKKLQDYRMGENGVQAVENLNVRLTYVANLNKMSINIKDPELTQVNKAYMFADTHFSLDGKDLPGNPDNPNDKTDIRAEIESRYGRIDAKKVTNDGTTALKGAEFQLYKCNAGTGEATIKPGAKPLNVGGKDKWVSNDKGEFSIVGIQLEDYANGGAANTGEFDYCLVESKAPRGYTKNPAPIRVELNNNTRKLAPTLVNIPSNGGFDLPLTGENGVLALGGLGIIGTLGLIGFFAANERKKKSMLKEIE